MLGENIMEMLTQLEYSHARQQKLIELLLLYRNKDGVCKVSPSILAEKMQLSEAMVNKILIQLQKCGHCVEIIANGRYIVHKADLKLDGPWSKVMALMDAVADNSKFPELSQAEQLEKLGFSLYELQMAKSFLLCEAVKQRSNETQENLQIPFTDNE